MISFITGLPGAGKGVYSVIRIIDVLQTTDMPILTNFAIELYPWVRKLSRRRSRGEKGLIAHLSDTFGQTYNADKRVHVLSDKQIQDFYLWRVSEAGKLVEIGCNRGRDGAVESLDESAFSTTVPCYYLVDEAWKFWGARNWQKVPGGFQFYNAQHRKAGDNLDITAQAASQIDKQMRVLVQEYHSLVNHGYRKMGIFRQPNVISVFVTNEPPELRSKSLGALPKIIKFDRDGIGGSFDTAKGAGVQGMGGDIERKRKGLPAWGLPVLVVTLAILFVFVACRAGGVAGGLLTGGVLKTGTKAVGHMMPPVVTNSIVGNEGVRIPVSSSVISRNVTPGVTTGIEEEYPLAITGWTKWGTNEMLILNDGSTVTVPSMRCGVANKEVGIAIVDRRIIGWEKKRNQEKRYEKRVRQFSPY